MSEPILVLNCGSSSIKLWGNNAVELDARAKGANAPIISRQRSRVLVAVEPINEEWIAATHAARILAAGMAHVAQP